MKKKFIFGPSKVFQQVVARFYTRVVSLPNQAVRFCASVNLVRNGFAIFPRHVRVDALSGARVGVFPHTAPENSAIDIPFVDVRLDATVRAQKPKHDFHGCHFFAMLDVFF